MPRANSTVPHWIQAFLETQRIPSGSSLSTWLHGATMTTGDHDRVQGMEHEASEKRPTPVPTARYHLERYSAALRSPTSTRSLMDQLQSPINFSRPITYDPFANSQSQPPTYTHPAFGTPDPVEQQAHKKKMNTHHRRATNKSLKAPQPTFFASKDPKIRLKAIGTLASGTLLVIVLTAYLALATSNIVPTTAFHGGFIFVVLVLTMIFAHFLIRLCMLSFRPRQPRFIMQKPSHHRHHHHRHGRRHHHHHHHRRRRPQHDLEDGLPPARPIPRLPTSSDMEERRPRSRESADTDKDLPAPPPAYGWWRGSVRVDPEDIRYRDPDQSDLQQQTRSLVFAGSGHRPPSYTSDPVEVQPIARPAPLFGGRGNPRGARFREI